ncbi:MAG: ATP-binding cassette domain-containing protein [Acutalibacteraceae bacterium]|jgi:putative ABC transport system ATP-binding protein|nr:ATP-binding cassette domain-containing protein [Acutalibacteraceae bacterium]
MLEIKNLSKTFLKGTPNEHKALDGISLSLDKGEFVTVIGSNGAGKSTLFNAIAGEFLCDGGKIVLDGKNITYQKEYIRAKDIGRLFQDPMRGTAPDLTIEENLALVYSKATRPIFSPALKKRDVEFFREKLLKLNMGLEDRLKTKMGQLSGGQRQAVTLMMSTLVTPKLLLLDEHTAALDPLTAEKVLDITQRIVAENSITTMMITHNIKSALKLGTRTIMLECGKSVLDLKGDERNNMTVQDLLGLYRQKSGKELDNDRMLLTGE